MSVIIIPRKHLRQPQGRAEIDVEHSLARGIDLCFTGSGGLRNLAPRSEKRELAGIGERLTATPEGESLEIYGTNVNLVAQASGMLSPLAASEEFTIEVLLRMTAATPLGHVFGAGAVPLPSAGGTPGGRQRSLLIFGGAGNKSIYFWGDNADLSSDVVWREDGSLQHVVVTRAGSSMRFYRDGVEIYSGTTPALTDSGTWAHIGGAHLSAAAPANFKLPKGALYRSAKSAEEVRELYQNPWQIFRADPIRIYSLPSGPIGLSWSSLTASGITPTTATLTLGGITR